MSSLLLLSLAFAFPAEEAPEPPKPLDLGPRDVVVVANSKSPESLEVARHYLKKRGVPESNLVALPLPLPQYEEMSRADFNEKLRDPLLAELRLKWLDAKIILLVYGVPLRVLASYPSEADQKKTAQITKEKEKLAPDLAAAREKKKKADLQHTVAATPETAKAKEEAAAALRPLDVKSAQIENALIVLAHVDSLASVDSELALLRWGDYALAKWQFNPMNWRTPKAVRGRFPTVLMVARIDGTSVELCKRMIDDAVETEQKGLTGKLCIDLWAKPFNLAEDPTGTAYGGYDESLRELFRLVKDNTKFPTQIDTEPAVAPPGTFKECALYCGWYSHASFVDSCVFRKGAVAVHIASSEAVSLRDAKCSYWCKNQLEKGACATMGPVAEPYLFAFPRPEEFFGFLMTGQYTLAECFYNTVSVNSWRMVLVGDPLYRPFAKNPQLKPEQVKPSPAGSKNLFGG